jgi:hypothetical protein
MATLAVAFASEKPIPDTTDRACLAQCCAWMHGTYMAWIRLSREVPEAQRPKVPGAVVFRGARSCFLGETTN